MGHAHVFLQACWGVKGGLKRNFGDYTTNSVGGARGELSCFQVVLCSSSPTSV